jgi:DNA-binding PadR family transcriptional regulator
MANNVLARLGRKGVEVPSLSEKEALILGLLIASGEMYGLEIVAKSDGEVGRGTVYVTLARMQEKGYVDSKQEEQAPGATGLPRRLYRVTGEGLRVLKAWERAADAFMRGTRLAT